MPPRVEDDDNDGMLPWLDEDDTLSWVVKLPIDGKLLWFVLLVAKVVKVFCDLLLAIDGTLLWLLVKLEKEVWDLLLLNGERLDCKVAKLIWPLFGFSFLRSDSRLNAVIKSWLLTG